MAIHFFVNFDIFQMAVSCVLLGLFTAHFGDFVKLGLHFMTRGSIVVNPIIYRLVPSLSRYEIRQ